MNASVTVRPVQPSDSEFLYQVYASTRIEELALTDWDDSQKRSFLRMQFDAQHRHYQKHYLNAAFTVVLLNGEAIGRLYVARWDREIRIVDIALLPAFRRHGIGSALLKDILAEGSATGRTVTIHVEQFNPAMKLYERLGFRKTGEASIYYLMECSPQCSGQIQV